MWPRVCMASPALLISQRGTSPNSGVRGFIMTLAWKLRWCGQRRIWDIAWYSHHEMISRFMISCDIAIGYDIAPYLRNSNDALGKNVMIHDDLVIFIMVIHDLALGTCEVFKKFTTLKWHVEFRLVIGFLGDARTVIGWWWWNPLSFR